MCLAVLSSLLNLIRGATSLGAASDAAGLPAVVIPLLQKLCTTCHAGVTISAWNPTFDCWKMLQASCMIL